ncbi:hypothetical protein, partial [Mycobacterium persicum]|uniref:hypothetical protein n=1 Tax=Mycobacterium persicum TaxID=1487726 RepID=UPI001A7E0A37
MRGQWLLSAACGRVGRRGIAVKMLAAAREVQAGWPGGGWCERCRCFHWLVGIGLVLGGGCRA